MSQRNLILFYNTLPTALPHFKLPSADPSQPHLVQVAALLVDLRSRQVIEELDLAIRPDGWEIPQELVSARGAALLRRSTQEGVAEREALSQLLALWSVEPHLVRVAHGEPLHARLVRIALMRHFDVPEADEWKAGEGECTAMLAKPFAQVPATDKMRQAGRGGFKQPSAREAFRHFFGRELDVGGAIVDARACMAVWFAIKQPEVEQIPALP